MATATPKSIFNRNETQKRIRHPLQALRGYIRSYVTMEGLAVALIYLAIWFWVGLAIDYGMFGLHIDLGFFSLGWFDWIKELDRNFDSNTAFMVRGLFLTVFLLGLIAIVLWKVVSRLFIEFSDSSLALVLERRFPKLLGDRLITAVELANPENSETYGYSQVMVDHTIQTAAQRVEQLPIRDVFDWKRLYTLWALAIFGTVGLYALVLIGGLFWQSAMPAEPDRTTPSAFASTNRLGWVWTKRNVLLMNKVYWPTESFVEVIRFQDSPRHPNEMRVGAKQARPDVKARAFEYVIYDPQPDRVDEVRPLKIADLKDYLNYNPLETIPLPASWGGWQVDLDTLSSTIPNTVVEGRNWDRKTAQEVRKAIGEPRVKQELENAKALNAVEAMLNWHTWSVDELAYQLENGDIRRQLRQIPVDGETSVYDAFESMIGEVKELAASNQSNWNIRRLQIPETVVVNYRGRETKSQTNHQRLSGNKYLIGLSELTESVDFTVRGNNYYTASKRIELVPPPALDQLYMNKWEPAYLYYRIQADANADGKMPSIAQQMKLQTEKLKGKTQQFLQRNFDPNVKFTKISDIVVGSTVELVVTSKVELKDGVRIDAVAKDKRKLKSAVVPDSTISLETDKKTFRLKIENVNQPHEFVFLYSDLDNVEGSHHFLLEPEVDAPPVEARLVELTAILRKPQFKETFSSGAAGGSLDGFLITPDALLPFQGEMKDKWGLALMEWAYEYEEVDFELVGSGSAPIETKDPKASGVVSASPAVRRSTAVASILQNITPNIGITLTIPEQARLIQNFIELDMQKVKDRIRTGKIVMPRFDQEVEILGKNAVDYNSFLKRRRNGNDLPQPAWPQLWSLKQEQGFDVREFLPLLKTIDPAKEPQKRYKLLLQVAATDNNIESGPNTTYSKAPVTFLIVSENELLSQILIQEEELRARLERAVGKLREGKTVLDEQISKLNDPGKIDQISLIGIRVDEIRKAVQDSATTAREVYADYNRILQELKINRMKQEKIQNIEEKIVDQLAIITDPNEGNYADTEEALGGLWQKLENDIQAMKSKGTSQAEQNRVQHLNEARDANTRLELLIRRMDEVLEAMSGELSWGEIVREATELERLQRTVARAFAKAYEDETKKLLELLD